MKPKFKKTVDAGDLLGTRISLADEMMLDPRGNSFREMRSYAESAFNNLYEQHDGASFNQNKMDWNEKLLFAVRNDLDSNFSRERVEYYCQLASFVLKDKADNLQREEERAASQSRSTNESTGHYYSQYETRKASSGINPIYAGLAIGGVLVGASGLIMGKAVIATIGVVGAAIGGGLIYNERKQ